MKSAFPIPRGKEDPYLKKKGHQKEFQQTGLPKSPLSSVQLLSPVWLFATPWIAAHQASLSITFSQSLLKLMPIKSVMPSSHLILCRPLLLPPLIPPNIRVFSNESTLCMSPRVYYKYLILLNLPYVHRVPILSTEPSIKGASLVVQWLRIHLIVQRTLVLFLVKEGPTCLRVTKPVHLNS